MKRLILIIIILFTGTSLMAQPVPYQPEWISITKDSLIYRLPAIVDLGTQEHHFKQKSSPRQYLKSRITYLMPIGLIMYMFRDDLQEWSINNDKLAHLFLSYGMGKIFGWKFALGFMLAVEATQIDVFGISGRYEDTAADLFMDGCGIGFSLKF